MDDGGHRIALSAWVSGLHAPAGYTGSDAFFLSVI